MFFISEEKIQKLIDSTFERWGFKKATCNSRFHYSMFDLFRRDTSPYEKDIEKLNSRLNLLIGHLGLEYYKKEIKENDGIEYTEEGFKKRKR